MTTLEERARILIEALPYLRSYRNARLVVKYGGAAMLDASQRDSVLKDIVLLSYVGMEPVLVHGGGPEISEMQARLGKSPTFAQGLRVTDQETAEIAQMVLVGKTNPDLVAALNHQGGRAVGVSGKDGGLLETRRLEKEGVDLGYVGEIVSVRPELLMTLMDNGFLPVVAPVAMGPAGETLNLNADHVAGKLAVALGARKLFVLTDTPGVLEDPDDPSRVLSELLLDEAEKLIANGRVTAGMIPKLQACIEALEGGVERCHIIDGRILHAVLMELFTDRGIGTMLFASQPQTTAAPAAAS